MKRIGLKGLAQNIVHQKFPDPLKLSAWQTDVEIRPERVEVMHSIWVVGLIFIVSIGSVSSSEIPTKKIKFESAFEIYKPWKPENRLDWRSVNDLVGRIGGWRVYSREPYLELKPTASSNHQKTVHGDHAK